ncbi:hypothetical protein KCU69_g75, partial [Aureobasidium melanogenum]
MLQFDNLTEGEMVRRRNECLWWISMERDVSFTVSVVTMTESQGCCLLMGNGMHTLMVEGGVDCIDSSE